MLKTVTAIDSVEQIENVFTVDEAKKEFAKELKAPIISINARIEANPFKTVSKPEKR